MGSSSNVVRLQPILSLTDEGPPYVLPLVQGAPGHSLPCPLADGGGRGWGSGLGGLTKPCPGRGAFYPHPSPPPLRRGGDRKLTPPRPGAGGHDGIKINQNI